MSWVEWDEVEMARGEDAASRATRQESSAMGRKASCKALVDPAIGWEPALK